MPVSPELLEILRCPKCQSEVQINEDETEVRCLNSDCKLIYPVRDGIPVMLESEARVDN
jgi:uncharacterized protein